MSQMIQRKQTKRFQFNRPFILSVFTLALSLWPQPKFAYAQAQWTDQSGLSLTTTVNVGIGTTTPDARLTLDAPDNTMLTIKRGGTNRVVLGDIGTDNAGNLLLYDASGTLRTLIRGGADSVFTVGNVGIGTPTADAKLRINNTADLVGLYLTHSNANSAATALEVYATGLANQFSLAIGGRVQGADPYIPGLVVQTGGNVGIGTTTPEAKLSVHGYSSNAESVALSLYPATSGGLPAYGIGMGPAGSEGYLTYRSGTGNSSIFGHKFFVNNLEIMRLAGDGNLNIGTTALAARINLYGNGNQSGILNLQSISNGGDGSLAFLGPFAYINSDSAGASYWSWGHRYDGDANAWVRTYSGLPLVQTMLDTGGNFRILTDTSATSSPPSFTDRFIVTNAGDVGIGTMSFGFSQGGGLIISRPGISTLRLENTLDSKNFELEIQGDGVHFAGMNSGQPFMFDVGAVERVRFDTNGNVGIGTPGPGKRLHIVEANGNVLRLERSNATSRQWDINIKPTGNFVIGDNTSQTDRFTIDTLGNIGIGLTNPGHRLSLVALGSTAGFDKLATTNIELYSNNNPGAGEGIITLHHGGVVAHQLRYNNGNLYLEASARSGYGTNPNPNLIVGGNLTVSGSLAAKYQDVAEWVPTSQSLLPGTVVVLDTAQTNQVLSSSKAYDTKVAGVVSGAPGLILGEGGEGKVMVATTGRVKVKVDATKKPVQVGDLLVTSDKEGIAMKSEPLDLGGVPIHRPGTLIGKALEPLKEGEGEILVLLSLQ